MTTVRTASDQTTATAATALARARALRWLRRPQAGEGFLQRPSASVHLLLLAGCGLLGFGVLMAASTTIAAAHDGAMWAQLVKELEFVALGVPVLWFAVRLPPRGYRLLAYPALVLATVALAAVLVPGIGVQALGARRWIDLGPLQVQPSEFAKLAVLLWGADLLARKQQLGTLDRARHLFVPLVPAFVLICGLVMLEPDLGTTLCFVMILLGLLWTVGLPLRYFAVLLAMVGCAVTALAISAPYRVERLLTFTDPFKDPQGAGFHTVEGLYALASGGLFGVGLGNGTSKYSWVPNANTDYVFSVVGEELGLIGTIAVLGFFGLFAFTGMRISRRSVDPFARLAAGAATIWICGQALINIGYVTALLPVTGIPLPFISAGGTSLLATFLVFGMLVSFARNEPAAAAAAQRAAVRHSRGRVERWLHLPVPRPYVAAKRRARRAAPPRPVRPAPRRARTAPPAASGVAPPPPAVRAVPRPQRATSGRPAPREPVRLRPTGTDATPGAGAGAPRPSRRRT